MKKSQSVDSDFIELELDHEGKSTFKFISELGKRGKAFKRMLVWAMANDLHELVISKIPGERRFSRLRDALVVGEGPDDTFAVFIDTKASKVNKIDAPSTLIYVKPRRIQDRIRPEITILSNNSPWTVETIPFWPDSRQAMVVKRKVNKRIVDNITKLRNSQKLKVERELSALGQRSTDNAIARRRMSARKAKAVPDMAFEMLTLEFGGGSERGQAIWRRSLKELIPGKIKTVLKRYKQIQFAIGEPRSGVWKNWPRVDVKVKAVQLRSFIKFQKQLGY